jgi:hypothetical protein
MEGGIPAASDRHVMPPGQEGIHDLGEGDFPPAPGAAAIQKKYVHEIPGSGDGPKRYVIKGAGGRPVPFLTISDRKRLICSMSVILDDSASKSGRIQ